EAIGERLGWGYLPDAPPTYRGKKGAQEAHEAIRPSEIAREPRGLAGSLTRDQLALYRLIWERFLASQMLPAVYDTVAAEIEATSPAAQAAAGDAPGPWLFRAQGATLQFAGFMAIYVESRDEVPTEDDAEVVIPPLEVELDRIEEGDTPWVDTVRSFYKRFAQDLRRAGGKMENLKRGTETGQACPTCGQPLLERWGRFGRFLACSAYPECRFTQNLS